MRLWLACVLGLLSAVPARADPAVIALECGTLEGM